MAEVQISFKQKSSHVVTLLTLLNVAVYFLWGQLDETFMAENFLVSAKALDEGRWWCLITSVFSHNAFIHLFLNMFVLANFGRVIEQIIGSGSFIKFYLLAGIVSSLVHSMVSAWLIGSPELSALGASGAISGIILVFCLLFPKEKILLLGFIPIPALFGAMIFVGLDLWGLSAQSEGGGLPIGHGAHLGGAVSGIFYYFFILRHKLAAPKVRRL